MRYKRKLVMLFVFVVLIATTQLVLPNRANWSIVYADNIFVPFQSLRNVLFGWSQLSFGDLLYFLAAVYLLSLIIKWIYYIIKLKQHSAKLGQSLLNTATFISGVYLLFLIGWGGNYYKPSLSTYWYVDSTVWVEGQSELLYDSFLIEQLNIYATNYKPVPFKEVRKAAMSYYKNHTDCKARLHGLNIKPSIYGYFMQHLGIQGYYNPITGEAQVNRFLPSFMLPFVVLHEMAHQAGIAAEDDANLLAYTIGIQSNDSSFRYAAYLNMWLYNHSKLKQQDSLLANEMKEMLNPVTTQHLDTLRQIRERYRSELSSYSTIMYDAYLKALQQEEGIGSYSEVISAGWAWEQATDTNLKTGRLRIP